MRNGDLLARSWARVRLVFRGSDSSLGFMSGGLTPMILLCSCLSR